MKIKIEKIRLKILLTILLVALLSLIGACVFFTKKYYGTDNGKTKIYAKELGNTINLEGSKEILLISKVDVNRDDVEDYIVLLGEPKYEEIDTTKVKIFKSLSSNLELYNNISIEYVNGKDNNADRYDTKSTFGKDVKLVIFDNKDRLYIQVSDNTSGNIALLYLNEGKLENVISNTFNTSEFVGYTIQGKFDESERVKLDITLDNYGKNYLEKKEETFNLDYTDTQINSNNYRLTYMSNKFSDFKILQEEDESKVYLIGTQYILYSNNKDLNKNEGFVNSKFEIKEDGKLEFISVNVEK